MRAPTSIAMPSPFQMSLPGLFSFDILCEAFSLFPPEKQLKIPRGLKSFLSFMMLLFDVCEFFGKRLYS